MPRFAIHGFTRSEFSAKASLLLQRINVTYGNIVAPNPDTWVRGVEKPSLSYITGPFSSSVVVPFCGAVSVYPV